MRFSYTDLHEMRTHAQGMRDACLGSYPFANVPDREGITRWQTRIDIIESLIGECWENLDEVEYIVKHTP